MADVGKGLLACSAAPMAFALALVCAAPARAESDLRLFSGDTLELNGDLRLVGVDGEQSWVDGGFGKLRSGGSGDHDLRVTPQLGNANLIWQPQFTWSLS